MTVISVRVGVVVVSSAILTASLTGCGSASGHPCSGAAVDYGSNAHGEATPNAALVALLDKQQHGPPASAWRRDSSTKAQVIFQSGSSRVSVFQVPDTSWVVDEYTFCG
jgi:hypothetical protein